MLKIILRRPTATKTVIINDAAVASVEIIKQLSPGGGSPDQYSLVLRGTGPISWVVAADKTQAQLPALTAMRDAIWTQITAGAAVIDINGEDLPDIPFKPDTVKR